MSLKHFHRFFIVLCMALFSFTGFWASGHNPSALVTPWLVYSSVLGGASALAYLFWHLRAVRLPA